MIARSPYSRIGKSMKLGGEVSHASLCDDRALLASIADALEQFGFSETWRAALPTRDADSLGKRVPADELCVAFGNRSGCF